MRISANLAVRSGAALGLALALTLGGVTGLWAETTKATTAETTAQPAAATAADSAATAAPAGGDTADVWAGVETDGPVPDAVMKDGETLFLRNCRQCHGTRGTAGVPLKDNENVADASYVASVILIGPGYMAGFAEALTDDQIAAIATYARNSWGNDYGAVTPQDVADMR